MKCTRCVRGKIVIPLPVRVPSGAVIGYAADKRTCPCCEGKFEKCENCEKGTNEKVSKP